MGEKPRECKTREAAVLQAAKPSPINLRWIAQSDHGQDRQTRCR